MEARDLAHLAVVAVCSHARRLRRRQRLLERAARRARAVVEREHRVELHLRRALGARLRRARLDVVVPALLERAAPHRVGLTARAIRRPALLLEGAGALGGPPHVRRRARRRRRRRGGRRRRFAPRLVRRRPVRFHSSHSKAPDRRCDGSEIGSIDIALFRSSPLERRWYIGDGCGVGPACASGVDTSSGTTLRSSSRVSARRAPSPGRPAARDRRPRRLRKRGKRPVVDVRVLHRRHLRRAAAEARHRGCAIPQRHGATRVANRDAVRWIHNEKKPERELLKFAVETGGLSAGGVIVGVIQPYNA